MPDPRRLLTLLNAGIINIDRAGTGVPDITASDVAAAVAGVSDWRGQLIVLAKWGGQAIDERALAEGLASRFYTKIKLSQEKIHRLALLAMADECVMRPSPCKTCGGRGEVMTNKLIACQVCSGSGHRDISARKKAAAIGVSPPTWKNFEADYKRIRDFIAGLEADALKTIKDRLG